MKKIIVGLFAFVFLFVGQKAFASVTWNTYSNDCNTIAIAKTDANGQNGVGFGNGSSPCWLGEQMNANPGDFVKVRIYYHNTSNETAYNTKLKIVKSENSNNYIFSGQIVWNGGVYYSNNPSSVYLTIPSNQTLNYLRTEWYPDQTSTATTYYNQNIFSQNGLPIGNILPDNLPLSHQGTAMAIFQVSNNQPQVCKINNFTADDYSITSGTNTNLHWSTTGCNNVTITPFVQNNLPVNGSASTPNLYQNTTYTLSASGSNGSDSKQLTINVSQPAQMTGDINANPTTCYIPAGQNKCSTNLTWNTTNPQGTSQVTYNSNGNPTVLSTGNNGSVNNLPVLYGSRTYFLYNSGIKLDETTVNGVCASGSSFVNGYCKQNVNPSSCKINSFYANPTSVTSGQMSTLYWNTEGCTTIRLNGNLVNNPNGSQNVYPNSTTTYTLDAENSQGIGVGAQATVSVVNNPNNNCRITQFDASDTSISEGDYSRLTWDTEGCDKVKITDLGFVNLNGSDKVYPTSDKTYTITAYDEDGSTITDTVRIYVDEEDEEDSCQIDSFTTSDNYINSGDRVTLRWRTTGCDDVSISRIGDVDNDGSEDVYPYDSTTYTLRARGNGDSDSDTVNITVGNDDRHYNGNVVTTVATGVSQTGAQLNGYLTGSNTGNANVYFEYGTTVNLGQRTSSRYAGSNYFNDYISGLSPKTIYYFRAVSNSNSSGVQYGAIEVFQTPGNQVIYYNNNNTTTTKTTKVIQGVTVIGTESPIVLRIENRYQTVGIGDVIDYTVFYKNISNMRLANPMVQVYIPKGITLLNASVGSYSEQDRILSVPLNDLYGDDEGVIYLQGRVDSIDNNLAQIVSTAVIAYTTPNGAQQNAMAYVFNSPRINNMNVLGASAFGSGLFLGMNLVGWLLLITFILLLVLLVRSFYSHKETVVSTIHNQ